MWPASDLYGNQPGNKTPSTGETVTEAGSVQRGASMSWLAILALFFVFRVLYERAT